MRLLFCGDTRMEWATPRTRFTSPSSIRLMGGSVRTVGTFSFTSPPPCDTDARHVGLTFMLRRVACGPE